MAVSKYKNLDDIFEKAAKWLDGQGNWKSSKSAILQNLKVGMNKFSQPGNYITEKDIMNTIDRQNFKANNKLDDIIFNMGENTYPDIKRGDVFSYGSDYYAFDRIDDLDGSYIFKDTQGRDLRVAGGPTSDFNKIDDASINLNIDDIDEYVNTSYELYSGKQYYEELLNTQGEEAANEFFEKELAPLRDKLNATKESIDNSVNKRFESYNHNDQVSELLDWDKQVREKLVTNNSNNNSNINPSTNQDWKNLEAGDQINLDTGVIEKADGRIVYPDGRVVNPDGTPWDPNTATNTAANVATNEVSIHDLDSETLANLTNDEIRDEWAKNSTDYDEAINLRNQARQELNMDPIPDVESTGRNPGIDTQLNNNFRGNTANTTQNSSTSEPVVNEEPIINEEPIVNEEPVVNKEPVANEEPIINEEPIANNANKHEPYRTHPDMFEDLDQFADLTDDDIRYFSDSIFDPDKSKSLKKQKIKEWQTKREQALDARKIQKQQRILDNPDEYLDAFTENYKNNFYGNNVSNTVNDFEFKNNYILREDYKNPTSYTANEMNFEVDADGNTKINKTGNQRNIEIEQNRRSLLDMNRGAANSADDIFSWMKKHNVGIAEGLNLLSTVSTYKENRKQGRSVASSAVRAAGSFVAGEMLGFWGYLGLQAAVGLPKAAIKGAEMLYKENRKMNSAANQQVFGGAQFADNQQLATMRQSGMEMAKMAQYNLQQTLMGNEATHLHR